MKASCDDLRTKYLDALSRKANWTEIWDLFVSHGWYQDRLHPYAKRVMWGSGLADDWREVVEQEAMILFGLRLFRRAAAIDQIEEPERSVAIFRYQLCTYEEIVELTGLTMDKVRGAWKRARRRLRAILGKNYPEDA